MPDLKHGEWENLNIKRCRAKTIYPGIEAGKKDCLCRCLKIA